MTSGLVRPGFFVISDLRRSNRWSAASGDKWCHSVTDGLQKTLNCFLYLEEKRTDETSGDEAIHNDKKGLLNLTSFSVSMWFVQSTYRKLKYTRRTCSWSSVERIGAYSEDLDYTCRATLQAPSVAVLNWCRSAWILNHLKHMVDSRDDNGHSPLNLSIYNWLALFLNLHLETSPILYASSAHYPPVESTNRPSDEKPWPICKDDVRVLIGLKWCRLW